MDERRNSCLGPRFSGYDFGRIGVLDVRGVGFYRPLEVCCFIGMAKEVLVC